ncbi:WhiB family transcriptional regulator [Streptomyces olivaceus]|uniref:WhiB family transcriptional regulator n=1 Tax=Streptomyces olivaceus TaxID=47716 RepID=UPI00240E2F86|nr:WhiB family transcriptional regulator [Streptomyces olivaceus]
MYVISDDWPCGSLRRVVGQQFAAAGDGNSRHSRLGHQDNPTDGAGCPVRTECLAHALDLRIEHGIWGEMTERERRALLRRRPLVTSWRHLLDAARSEHEQTAGAEDRQWGVTG